MKNRAITFNLNINTWFVLHFSADKMIALEQYHADKTIIGGGHIHKIQNKTWEQTFITKCLNKGGDELFVRRFLKQAAAYV